MEKGTTMIIDKLTLWMILLILFFWLMLETNWLRVRLVRLMPSFMGLVISAMEIIIGLTLFSTIAGLVESFNFREERHIPQGIKNHLVRLESPEGKFYGMYPVAQAERIARKHEGWDWQSTESHFVHIRGRVPKIISLIPTLIFLSFPAWLSKITKRGDDEI